MLHTECGHEYGFEEADKKWGQFRVLGCGLLIELGWVVAITLCDIIK